MVMDLQWRNLNTLLLLGKAKLLLPPGGSLMLLRSLQNQSIGAGWTMHCITTAGQDASMLGEREAATCITVSPVSHTHTHTHTQKHKYLLKSNGK